MAKINFTARRIDSIPATGKEQLIWDAGQRFFGLRVGKTGTKSFCVQRDRNGKTFRMSIGRWPDWDIQTARQRAREIIQMLDSGLDPRAAQRRATAVDVTLWEAVEIHCARMRRKRAADGSIKLLRDDMNNHLGDWYPRALTSIDHGMLRRRHESLSIKRKDGRGGPTAANRMVRHFSAVWNSARRVNLDLPAEVPITTVELNPESGKTEPIPPDLLAVWRAGLDGYKSQTRRDWLLTLLYTSLRRRDGASITWTDINLGEAILHRPAPKGGMARAFSLPIPSPVLAIFERRRESNPPGTDLVFPTRRRSPRNTFGPVVEFREPKLPVPKGFAAWPSPHQLRATWATTAMSIGVDLLTIQAVMNHSGVASVAGVTAQYLSPSAESFRPAMERVAAELGERMNAQE